MRRRCQPFIECIFICPPGPLYNLQDNWKTSCREKCLGSWTRTVFLLNPFQLWQSTLIKCSSLNSCNMAQVSLLGSCVILPIAHQITHWQDWKYMNCGYSLFKGRLGKVINQLLITLQINSSWVLLLCITWQSAWASLTHTSEFIFNSNEVNASQLIGGAPGHLFRTAPYCIPKLPNI